MEARNRQIVKRSDGLERDYEGESLDRHNRARRVVWKMRV
jgi:hypothetical protein